MVESRRGVPIAEAAARLGVGVELLRKRAQRGTMPARKVDGRWFVDLDVDRDGVGDIPPAAAEVVPSGPGHPVQDTPSRTGRRAEAAPPRAVSPAARSQFEAVRDEWLVPLVERIGALEREVGRLEAQGAAVAAERDRLRAERDRDRGLADRLVDLLQAERDEAWARVAELEGAAGRIGRYGIAPALLSRLRRMTEGSRKA